MSSALNAPYPSSSLARIQRYWSYHKRKHLFKKGRKERREGRKDGRKGGKKKKEKKRKKEEREEEREGGSEKTLHIRKTLRRYLLVHEKVPYK